MRTKKIPEYVVIPLLEQFILNCKKGKHLQKNGKRISPGSITNYEYLLKYLTGFSQKQGMVLRALPVNKLNKQELRSEDRYWKKFYLNFTEYMYKDRGAYDNYAAAIIKKLRAFYNYLNQVKLLGIGTFHKNFYARRVETPIVVLYPEQLNYLIYDKDLETRLPYHLLKVKDFFVFGCTVALRISDLLELRPENLETINGGVYMNAVSKKTATTTRIRLPQYAVDIVNKYKSHKKTKNKTLLPHINNVQLNIQIKELMEIAGWTQPYIKTREVRGKPQIIYRNPAKKEHFRFCDMITSHTMRRTAITTMLSLGMPEQTVRLISGHRPQSKEFYRYVSYSQSYLDTESDKVFSKLEKRVLITA